MNDTSSQVKYIYTKMMMQKSIEERMEMASSMFETSKKIIESSMEFDMTSSEKKIFLFKRLYGNDFSKREIEEITDFFRFSEKIQ